MGTSVSTFSQEEGLLSRLEFLEKISEAQLPTIVTNKRITYYNVPCAFDIEVSSFYYNGEKNACMYVWQFGILNWCTYGRTWEEFDVFMSVLSTVLGLDDSTRLVVYVHNLAYEWQFIRKRINWSKTFFLDNRKPVYAISGGFEYRCSLKLSSKSLKKVGEDLQKYKCLKKMGDLDYSLVRTSITPLTDKELGYCEADIRVLLCYIQEKIESDGDISLIPLTNTGYVRNYCRKACFKRWKRYKNLMYQLRLTAGEYSQLKQGFGGGFTHASARYSRRIVKDVGSFDFTSSYPYVMLSEKFPMSSGELVDSIKSEEDLESYLTKYCCLFDITIKNVIPKVDYDHPISASKLISSEGVVKDNGRVIYADSLTMTVTEQDYVVFREFYDWDMDTMEIHQFRIYEKGYLPTPFVKAILKLYKDKTVLKGVEGEEVNYMISKNMLNAAYGMIVTDIVRESIEYINDEHVSSKPDLEEAIKNYNDGIKRFLFYPWGVWVTSYARANLFSGILACGEDYIYSDTDSVKVRNYKDHMDYFNAYNELVDKKLRAAAEYHKIDFEEFSPLNKRGAPKPIGVWDFEGVFKRFKTVGAKRYIIERYDKDIDEDHPHYELTVAGVNKRKAMEYLEKTYADPFDGLNEGLIVPKEYSGRLLLDYCGDEPCSGEVEDYLGNVGEFSELSYIHMEPTTYELTYSADYKAYIDMLMEVTDDSW